VLRIVADLGNSRLKWGRLDDSGNVVDTVALSLEDTQGWRGKWYPRDRKGETGSTWSVSSVNPSVAVDLDHFFEAIDVSQVRWYRSAAEVPVRHAIVGSETAGADRALAVVAASASAEVGRPVLVVLCGTALTVERISADGIWQGGAIAAGLSLTARALHALTAQLPLVTPRPQSSAWGNATIAAIEAGVFWGAVGTIRELLTRQAEGLRPEPEVVWSGGDAEVLAPAVGWPGSRFVPDLVLHGLATVAAGSDQT
jgi:type III pantothenate kinase